MHSMHYASLPAPLSLRHAVSLRMHSMISCCTLVWSGPHLSAKHGRHEGCRRLACLQ